MRRYPPPALVEAEIGLLGGHTESLLLRIIGARLKDMRIYGTGAFPPISDTQHEPDAPTVSASTVEASGSPHEPTPPAAAGPRRPSGSSSAVDGPSPAERGRRRSNVNFVPRISAQPSASPSGGRRRSTALIAGATDTLPSGERRRSSGANATPSSNDRERRRSKASTDTPLSPSGGRRRSVSTSEDAQTTIDVADALAQAATDALLSDSFRIVQGRVRLSESGTQHMADAAAAVRDSVDDDSDDSDDDRALEEKRRAGIKLAKVNHIRNKWPPKKEVRLLEKKLLSRVAVLRLPAPTTPRPPTHLVQ